MSTNFNFTAPETLAGASGVQEGVVTSKGSTNGQVLGIDAENQVFRFLVEMPFPQTEEQIGARLGKKPKLKDANGELLKGADGKVQFGEQPVTSRIYGKVSQQPVYVQGDGQLMQLTAKLIAPVAGVEQETEDADEDI